MWLARWVSSRLPFRLNRVLPLRLFRPVARLPLLPVFRSSPLRPVVRLRLFRPVGSPPFRLVWLARWVSSRLVFRSSRPLLPLSRLPLPLVRLRSRPPLRPLLLLRFSRLRPSRPVGSPPFRLVWLARWVSSRLPFRLNRVLPLRLFRPVARLPLLPALRLSRLRLSRPVFRMRASLVPLFRLVWLARWVSSRLPFRLNRAPPFRFSRPVARLPLLPVFRFSPRLPLVRLRSRLPFRSSRPVALPWLLLAFRFSRLRPFHPAMPCLRPFGCRIRRSRLPSRRSLLRQELSLPPFSSLSLVGLERHRVRLRSRPPLRSDRLPTSPLPSKPPRPPCRRTVRSDHLRLLKRSRRRMPRRSRSRSPEPRGMADRLSL